MERPLPSKQFHTGSSPVRGAMLLWRNWQTPRVQIPVTLQGREGSTPSNSTHSKALTPEPDRTGIFLIAFSFLGRVTVSTPYSVLAMMLSISMASDRS